MDSLDDIESALRSEFARGGLPAAATVHLQLPDGLRLHSRVATAMGSLVLRDAKSRGYWERFE